MINRGNWQLSKKYLLYRKEVHLLADNSLRLEEGWIKHVLKWADETSFMNASKIRPTLPKFAIELKKEINGELISPSYSRKIIRTGYRLFKWLSTHQKGYRTITPEFLDTLRSPRLTGKKREFVAVTLDEILAFANAPANNIEERRIRASVCFWFLSGIRIGAFVSLPLNTIDLDNLEIKQWPSLGVNTKFKKHATTYMLDIPELYKVVKDWDTEVREALPNGGLWFAPLDIETGKINPTNISVNNGRTSRARKSLKIWCSNVGLPYKNPHSFRHGHAVYAIQKSNDLSDLKAISMNLMHENIQVTDGIYGIFSKIDIKKRISYLTKNKSMENEIIDIVKKAINSVK